MRFFLWILIGLSLALGFGVYLKFQGKNQGQAAATLNSSKVNIQSTNLIGYWTFDGADTSSTTATDRGGANNGTITEAVGKPGKIGQAFDFDGANDKVAMGDVLDRSDTDDLTLAGWFRRDTSDTDDTIIAKRNGVADTDDGYVLSIDDATDQLIFEVSEIGGSDEYQLASTTTFTTTDWYHFVVVWDQDSAANSEIYINGVDDNATDTGTIGNIGDLTTALAFTVGAESDNGNPFDGRLDDIRVYSNAFSTTQVSDLYNTASSAKVINAGQDNMLTNGLVGYWTFDGNDIDWSDTGTEIKDVSVNNNHGAVSGLTRSSVAIGKLGQGMSFDGVDDWMNVGMINNNFYAISFWINVPVNITNSTSCQQLFTYGSLNLGGNDQESIVLGSCTSFGTDETMTIMAAGANTLRTYIRDTITVGWHHAVISWNASLPRYVFFLDGIEQTAYTGSEGDVTLTAIDDFEIANGGDSVSHDYFAGNIDDVRIYSRALSEEEVYDLYKLGK